MSVCVCVFHTHTHTAVLEKTKIYIYGMDEVLGRFFLSFRLVKDTD